MFNISSICSHIPLEQMSITRLTTGRQISRTANLRVLANSLPYSLFFPVFKPSNYWMEVEVELVTSYWRILITIPVWQPSLFSLPKSGSVCEKIFSQDRQRDVRRWEGLRPRTDIVSIFSSALFIFLFCGNFLICLQLAPRHVCVWYPRIDAQTHKHPSVDSVGGWSRLQCLSREKVLFA